MGLAAVQQGARRRPVQCAEHLEQRRFPTTTLPGDGNKLALSDAKRHPAQSLDLSIVVPFFQFGRLENGFKGNDVLVGGGAGRHE